MNDNQQLRVLIVDDDAGMRSTLQRIMRAKGFEVKVAEDGYRAIQMAAEFEPHILLLDVKMPGINGVETFRQLKPICPDAAAIFMTAYSSSQLTQEARDEGAVEVLSKPVDIDDICGLIEQSAATRPVLVVDDDPRFRQSLTRALRTKGFHVHTAQGIDDTLEEFQSRPGCVVLLDMKLDGCSGLDVLARIRSVNQDVFAVLMTGFDELEPAMQAGLDSGAVRTLTKPFELDALVDIINSRPNASAE